jgi:cation diffusion facilitator family transporter
LKPQQQNLTVQKWVAGISVILLAIKLIAYLATRSVAILTDALESIVNVAAGFIGLYSLYVAAKPKDSDHPYGHGKAEFISAAIEGTMIAVAGVLILYKGIQQLINPVELRQLDYGMILIAITAVANFAMGYICLRIGKRNQSAALVASGQHLLTDTWSTVGIIAGIGLLFITGEKWIDSIVALLFGVFILYTGYRIVRKSIAGIMDEVDAKLLTRVVELLNTKRSENWVDLHNLRVIKYGSSLHVDCHLTVPWYFNVNEAHREIDTLGELVRSEFGESLEMFVHSDGCLYSQCGLCSKHDCPVRQHIFERWIPWTLENISQNKKHTFFDDTHKGNLDQRPGIQR